MDQQNSNSGAIFIVAGIAIIALIIGWLAFNRSGEDLTTTVGNEVADAAMATEQTIDQTGDEQNEASTDAEQEAARAEIRAELLALETRLEADESYEGAGEELEELQADLADTYRNMEGDARSNWQQLEDAFGQAVNNIQSGTANALDEVGGLLQMLEDDVRPNVQGDVNVDANATQ